MIIRASETLRELPAPPYAFGIGAFVVFSLLLYITLRFDRD
jgi:hypothetical protein